MIRSWMPGVGLAVVLGWLTFAIGCDSPSTARPERRVQAPTKARDQAATEKPKDGFTNSLGMQLLVVPLGEFLMGAPDTDDLARKDEKPPHRVRITRGYCMAAHEVTVGQFRAFVEATGFETAAETDGRGSSGYDPAQRGFEYDSPKYSWRVTGYSQDEKHPVVNVNWHDAQAFCKWLSKKEGRPYRLPTEAEWEFACRAGSSERFVTDEAVRGLRPAANLCDRALERQWDTSTVRKYGVDPAKIQFLPWDDGNAFTAPVGSYEPNALGLYDMLGNVGEFCADGYDADYYAESPVENPTGPTKETQGHVVRGGTFLNDAHLVRVTSRVECPDKYRNYVIGFRVVQEKDARRDRRGEVPGLDGNWPWFESVGGNGGKLFIPCAWRSPAANWASVGVLKERTFFTSDEDGRGRCDGCAGRRPRRAARWVRSSVPCCVRGARGCNAPLDSGGWRHAE